MNVKARLWRQMPLRMRLRLMLAVIAAKESKQGVSR